MSACTAQPYSSRRMTAMRSARGSSNDLGRWVEHVDQGKLDAEAFSSERLEAYLGDRARDARIAFGRHADGDSAQAANRAIGRDLRPKARDAGIRRAFGHGIEIAMPKELV